jgi:hypothetical protein
MLTKKNIFLLIFCSILILFISILHNRFYFYAFDSVLHHEFPSKTAIFILKNFIYISIMIGIFFSLIVIFILRRFPYKYLRFLIIPNFLAILLLNYCTETSLLKFKLTIFSCFIMAVLILLYILKFIKERSMMRKSWSKRWVR